MTIDDLTLHHMQELAAGYALGDLDDDELETLHHLLSTYPELQVEFDRLQDTLSWIPYALPDLDPSSELEAAVLQSAQPALATATPSPTLASSFTKPLSPRRYLAPLAGLIALLATLGLVFDNLRLRQSLQIAQQATDNPVTAILQEPNTKLISLTGSDTAATTASGSLLFVAGQWQNVVITFKGLPDPPDGQLYRLWARFSDGTVILCGEFEPNAFGEIVTQLEPFSLPNPGSTLTDVFATLGDPQEPLEPTGDPVLSQI